MPAQSLALRFPIVAETPRILAVDRIFSRLKERFDALISKMSTFEERADNIAKTVYGVVGFQFRNNPEKREEAEEQYKKLELHVCETTREMAEMILDIEGRKKTERAIQETIGRINEYRLKGLYLGNHVLINLEMIELEHKTSKEEQETCFVVTAIHEILHHFGGFENYKGFNLMWLDDAVAELVSRELRLLPHPETLPSLGCDSYIESVNTLLKLRDIIDIRSLINAFFSRNAELLKKEMLSKGLGEEEFGLFLQVVHGLSEGNLTIDSFNSWIRIVKRKKKAGEEQEGEPEESVQRPERETQARKPAEKTGTEDVTTAFASLRKKFAEKNLLPAEGQADYSNISSIEQVKLQIMRNYNSPSIFYANLAIETAEANLTIQLSKTPTAREIADYLDEVAQEFSRIHTVKPTVRQLAFAVVEESYYAYSHSVSVCEFFGVADYTAAEVKRFVKDVALDWESLKFADGEKTNEETAKRMRISASSKDELAGMFWGATIVAMACNSPVVNEIVVIEVLAAAKAKLCALDGECASDGIIQNLVMALDRNGSNPSKILHMANIPRADVDAYFTHHHYKKPNDETVRAMNALVGNLALAYPAAAIRFDAKRGFTRYMKQLGEGDNLLVPIPPGGTNSAGTMGKFTPYGKNTFSRILRQHGLPTNINPLFSGENVEKARKAQKRDYKRSDLEQVVDVYKEYKTDGRKGIKCDMESERPNGCLTPEEVLERGYALCLEHACLFMALNEGIKSRVLAFKVFRDEDGNPIPHICNGVIIDEKQISAASYAFEALAHRRARKTYYMFDEDQGFRESLIAREGVSDSEKRLILLDLSMQNFGAQYQEVRPILTDEELLSAHFVDRGSYYMRTAEQERALENFEAALKINPMDELARSHLIAYYSDIHQDPARVLELSHDPNLLVNTEDFVSRALVLVSLGRSDEAVEALLRALQLSESAVKAKLLLKDISKL